MLHSPLPPTRRHLTPFSDMKNVYLPSPTIKSRKFIATVSVVVSVFILSTVVTFHNTPHIHYSMHYTYVFQNRSHFSTIFSHFFPNTTTTSSAAQVSGKSNGFTREVTPSNGSSSDHEFNKKANEFISTENANGTNESNGFTREVSPSNGSSSDHEFNKKASEFISTENTNRTNESNGFTREVTPSNGSSSDHEFNKKASEFISTENANGTNESNGFTQEVTPSNGCSSDHEFNKNARENANGTNESNGFTREVTPSNGSSSDHEFNKKANEFILTENANGTNESNGFTREVTPSNGSSSDHKKDSEFISTENTNGTNEISRTMNDSVERRKRLKKEKINREQLEKFSHCNIFNGRWVKDYSNRLPMYAPGSCSHIDESFNCFLNGKPENAYEKYRWQPKDCNIPRWNGKKMLKLLKGKRLVYVGDSLNRNMWESMVCMLTNSVENKSSVYEANHKTEFRSEGSYSFLFTDYNCTVEFFRSPFLVQEWEMEHTNGSTKETLRLDLIHNSTDLYGSADILVFNTGHWWTHEKTAAGKGYYQEGSHVYDQLDAMEAYRRGMTTWARWIEANVNPKKTLVFFRGYSSSHFGGGQWNTGGQCDGETEPIQNEKDLPHDNNQMIVDAAENVLKWMKQPVFYLNITTMSEFRKDAHPSIYIRPNLTTEERKTQLKYQDCSHWCLPGVPDSWNEIIYAQLLMRHDQEQQRRKPIAKLISKLHRKIDARKH